MGPHVDGWVLGVFVADTVLPAVNHADVLGIVFASVGLEFDQSMRVGQHHLIQRCLIC